MHDPVVASDGFSYEREAIQAVLSTGNQLSPLTRELLTPVLVPNRALRRRIEEHEGEVDKMAARFEAEMVKQVEAQVAKQVEARLQAKEAETALLQEQLQELQRANGKRGVPSSSTAGDEPAAKRRSSPRR